MDNLDELDKFLEIHNLPESNQEESENLKRPITMEKIKAVIKRIPAKTKGLDQMTSEVNFTKHYGRVNLNSSQTIPKNPKRGNAPKLFL